MKALKTLVATPFLDVMAALGHVMGIAKPLRPTCLMLGGLLVTWFIYVPIHELLHVAGCVVTGGSVTELQIDAKYGGTILAKLFDFVVPASQYAGRLTGFDTKGSDWVYLATDFGPFVLTVLLGVPLLKICTRRKHPILFGAAVVIGLAPFYQIPNDYFEMGSTVVTRAVTVIRDTTGGEPDSGTAKDAESRTVGQNSKKEGIDRDPAGVGAGSSSIAFESIRSDDIFRLFEELFSKRSEMGLESTGRLIAGLALILLSFVTSIVLAFLTYGAGSLFSRVLITPKSNEAK